MKKFALALLALAALAALPGAARAFPIVAVRLAAVDPCPALPVLVADAAPAAPANVVVNNVVVRRGLFGRPVVAVGVPPRGVNTVRVGPLR